MINAFVTAWFDNVPKMREKFSSKHPGGYDDVVRAVVEMLAEASDDYDKPDPERIHVIDDGQYQGTLVYVIGSSAYQPDRYWYVKVTCSVCDTLDRIRNYSDLPPNEEQVRDYMTLALHIVQGLREMGDD